MQTVSLQDPTKPKSFLVFTNDEGKELRVPVGPEAIEAITRFAFAAPQEVPPEVEHEERDEVEKEIAYEEENPPSDDPDLDEEDPDATTFGGDVEEGDDDPDPVRPFELPKVPKSEAEIKSL